MQFVNLEGLGAVRPGDKTWEGYDRWIPQYHRCSRR
jgi:hypothetical protein